MTTELASVLRRALPLAAVVVVTVALSSEAGASAGCIYPMPPKALKIRVERGGFTYDFADPTRFGCGYYAFATGTADVSHPTTRERVLVVTSSARRAKRAAAFYRSNVGRREFLSAFGALCRRGTPRWSFTVRLTHASSFERIARLEAFARATHR
jgi:hypothetical protein